MRRRQISVGIAALLTCTTLASAQYRVPQGQWVWEEDEGWAHPIANPQSIAVDSNRVYVGTVYDGIVVYDRHSRVELTRWGTYGTGEQQFRSVAGITLLGNRLYAVDHHNHRIQVLRNDGTFLFRWGTEGNGPNEFVEPTGVATDGRHIYICDQVTYHVSVHTLDGAFVRMWGEQGGLPAQFRGPKAVAVDASHVYVADGRLSSGPQRVMVFTKQGQFVRQWSGPTAGGRIRIAVDGTYVYGASSLNDSYLLAWDKEGNEIWREVYGIAPHSPLYRPLALALLSPHIYIADYQHNVPRRVEIFRQVFRTFGSPTGQTNAIPQAEVVRQVQREGSGVIDLDYVVADRDSPVVSAYPLAFTGTTYSVSTAVQLQTLVEGTEANIGTNVTGVVTNRVSWDIGADVHVDYTDVRIAMLTRDERDMLDFHFLHLPAVGANPALVINRVPVTENELLNLWFWLMAKADPAIRLEEGKVYGVGGAYDGQLLAEGSTSIAEGRAFLFDLLGVREATAAELLQAREGPTPGSITKWEPRKKLPSGRPVKVNEFGFDTGSSDSAGWWVVRD